jgi:hypothetical protein
VKEKKEKGKRKRKRPFSIEPVPNSIGAAVGTFEH